MRPLTSLFLACLLALPAQVQTQPQSYPGEMPAGELIQFSGKAAEAAILCGLHQEDKNQAIKQEHRLLVGTRMSDAEFEASYSQGRRMTSQSWDKTTQKDRDHTCQRLEELFFLIKAVLMRDQAQ